MNDVLESIRNDIENAPIADVKPEEKPQKEKKLDKNKAKKWINKSEMPYDTGFPENCPVEPLGINGDDIYFLDQKRQMRVMKAEKLNKSTIMSLFCEDQALKYKFWPRKKVKETDDGDLIVTIEGWRPEQAADCLLAEASRKGVWNIIERVRGPGCWQDDKGKLVMHCGDRLYHCGKTYDPGQIGRHVYPSAAPILNPVTDDVGTDVGENLLKTLQTWNWRRPEIDPYLLLGWIVAGIVGGALGWRPLVWITGDAATGKSTLHELIGGILGPGGVIATADTTAAGISQTVGHAALPVAIDELEAEDDNKKAYQVISLARLAASGALKLRGGSDHTGSSFTVRNCFLFSSILIPPLKSQDRSRMAILELDTLPQGAKPPAMKQADLNAMGQKIRARILQQWDCFEDIINTWKTFMAKAGHGGRGSDQFGTLLACMDMVLFNGGADVEYMDKWSVLLNKSNLSETDDNESDHERCIKSLLTAQLDLFRSGERKTVGQWIEAAISRETPDNTKLEINQAKRALGNYGLAIVSKNNFDYLSVANSHSGLLNLFRETHWIGKSGTDGVWVQALRRIDGAVSDQQRFNGLKLRCTSIPLGDLFGKDDANE